MKKNKNLYPFMDIEGLNNAEIEGKETILLPDGRSFYIKGKSHANGGEDVFLPQSAKVYSNHIKLPKDITGILLDNEKNTKKMSPAEISKKFSTLPFHDVLTSKLSNRYDDIDKKTAALMVAKLSGIHEDIFVAQEDYKKEKGLNKKQILQDGGYANDFKSSMNASQQALYDSIDASPNMNPGAVASRAASQNRFDNVMGEANNYGKSLDYELNSLKGQLKLPYQNDQLASRQNVSPSPNLNRPLQNLSFKNGGELPKYQNGNTPNYALPQDFLNPYNTQKVGADISPYSQSGYLQSEGDRLSNPSQIFNNNPVTYNPGEIPRYNSEALNQFNANDFSFNPLDPSNAIPGKQRSIGNGYYGEPLSLDLTKANNQWFDWTGYDPNIPSEVNRFQTGFNTELAKRANRLGVSPEELIKQSGFSGTSGPNSLDSLHGEFTSTRQLPNLNTSPVAPLGKTNFSREFTSDQEPQPLALPNSSNPGDTVSKEVPVGIDYRDYVNGIQNGLLLSQLSTLEVENPYYRFSPSKVATTRFEPVNTKQSERAFNIAKESLENSNLPESVKQAQLSQMQATLQGGINQVDIGNNQGNLQNQNKNTGTLLNTLNSDSGRRDQSNLLYLQDRARGKELFAEAKSKLVMNAMDNWKATRQNKRQEELISQLSNNYNIDGKGNIVYEEGQGFQNSYDNLFGFSTSDDVKIAHYKAQIKALQNKE